MYWKLCVNLISCVTQRRGIEQLMLKGKKEKSLSQKVKKIILFALAFLILALAGFWFYVQIRTYPAESAALETIQNDPFLQIKEERTHYILIPEEIDPVAVPLIYYPGGLVAPEAYLYKMGRAAVELNTAVYVIKAPFNASIFNVNAAGRVMDIHNLDRAWVGGHSLGGITASRFTLSGDDRIFGLYLFGSYSDRDLSVFPGPVLSIMGLEDEIINRSNYEEAKAKLPLESLFLEIEGLNHSDFGNYGLQAGDGMSKLNDSEVIALIVNAIDRFRY